MKPRNNKLCTFLGNVKMQVTVTFQQKGKLKTQIQVQ